MYKINHVIYGKFLYTGFKAVTQKPPVENLILYFILRNKIHLPSLYGTLEYQMMKNNLINSLDKLGEFDYLGKKK